LNENLRPLLLPWLGMYGVGFLLLLLAGLLHLMPKNKAIVVGGLLFTHA
jgi:hypothetical protein